MAGVSARPERLGEQGHRNSGILAHAVVGVLQDLCILAARVIVFQYHCILRAVDVKALHDLCILEVVVVQVRHGLCLHESVAVKFLHYLCILEAGRVIQVDGVVGRLQPVTP